MKEYASDRSLSRRTLLLGAAGLGAAGAVYALHRVGIGDFADGNKRDESQVKVVPEEISSETILLPKGTPFRAIRLDIEAGTYTDSKGYGDEPHAYDPTVDAFTQKLVQAFRSANSLFEERNGIGKVLVDVEGRNFHSSSYDGNPGSAYYCVPPDVPVTLRMFEWTSFQSVMDNAIESAPSDPRLLTHLKYLREDSLNKSGKYIPYTLGGHEYDPVEQGRLFNVVDISSYMNIDQEWGNPVSNLHTLTVNTLTVMKFYPRSFIATLESLSRKDRKMFKDIANISYDNLKNAADHKDEVDKLFDPELIKYLKA